MIFIISYLLFVIYVSRGQIVQHNSFFLKQQKVCDYNTSYAAQIADSYIFPKTTESDIAEGISKIALIVRRERMHNHNEVSNTYWNRKLVDLSISDRRDLSIATLNLVYYLALKNTLQNLTVSGNIEPLSVTTQYLPKFYMDQVNDTLVQHHVLYKVAERLPCVEVESVVSISNPSNTHIQSLIPDDPYIMPSKTWPYGEWHLGGPDTTEFPIKTGANVFAAWSLYRGENANIRIAVIDSGCTPHLDLKENYWGQDRGDIYIGADVTGEKEYPFKEPQNLVHGTSAAGMIAATPNNNFGGAGICWGCKITCMKVYNRNGVLDSAAFLRALNKLRSDINIIYIGFTSYKYSLPEAMMLEKLAKKNKLIIVPAGDNRCDIDGKYPENVNACRSSDGDEQAAIFPASYNLDNIITVGGTDVKGERSRSTSWGNTTVDIMAPSESLLLPFNTAVWPEGMAAVFGTPFAAAVVAGVAGLVWGSAPNLPAKEIKNILVRSARQTVNLQGSSKSNGIVDAYTALLRANGTRDSKPPQEHPAPTNLDMTKTYYLTSSTILSFSLIVPILCVVIPSLSF